MKTTSEKLFQQYESSRKKRYAKLLGHRSEVQRIGRLLEPLIDSFDLVAKCRIDIFNDPEIELVATLDEDERLDERGRRIREEVEAALPEEYTSTNHPDTEGITVKFFKSGFEIHLRLLVKDSNHCRLVSKQEQKTHTYTNTKYEWVCEGD